MRSLLRWCNESLGQVRIYSFRRKSVVGAVEVQVKAQGDLLDSAKLRIEKDLQQLGMDAPSVWLYHDELQITAAGFWDKEAEKAYLAEFRTA